ncbi:putative adenylyltransferase/sulfurtransferase MoeZ [Paenibacillus plantiphilus]|uniref:Adenylyltransferase/sulfurtransferase MoeZ n=1 Tax=Paenibacillus plantiphilus TaxID=2905650 RepID=A0ABN8G9J7_9BACL|nr:molybdopterin-synthase adenylyltransferase MoeB [Paenibacillus plantiphilus]CAH1199174.1 putative adenylyltransferase/sulfurtransferase MoeZ [Paenibacillus plantiphilus]
MSVIILIPNALRAFTEGLSQVEAEANTVEAALTALTTQYEDLQRHLFTDDGRLRSYVNVYVNEDDIRQREGMQTLLSEGDTVMLVPSIAGGSSALRAQIPPEELPELTKSEKTRYSRHLILPEVGEEGQRRLKNSRVLLIGTGGLGAPLAMYLAAAGVGTLGIVDFDYVDETNLQRQIIHGSRDIGRPKIASAKDRIKSINPNVNVIAYEEKLTSTNALSILKDYDVVADGTDNFQTRYLVNDACVLLGKPAVYGSVFRFEGQASVFHAAEGACYRCLYPEPPPAGLVPSCSEGGILGVLPGIIGTIQANETIKLLLGKGDSLVNRLLLFDALKMKFRELKLNKDPHCPICSANATQQELIDYEEFCGLKRPVEEVVPIPHITAKDLHARLEQGDDLQIIDIREPHELALGKLPGTRAIPFGQLVRRKAELDPAKDTIVVCKIGERSLLAIRALLDAGYTGRVMNLQDGINGWASTVDDSIARY